MEEKQRWWSSYLTVTRSCARKQSIQKILGEEYIWLHLNGKKSKSGNPVGKINKVLSSVGLRDCKQLSRKKKVNSSSLQRCLYLHRGQAPRPFFLVVRAVILLALIFCRVLSNSVSEKIERLSDVKNVVVAPINELAGS